MTAIRKKASLAQPSWPFSSFVPLVLDLGSRVMNIMVTLFIYIILAQGWNVIGGYTGQVNLGIVAFFGVSTMVTHFLWKAGLPIFVAISSGTLSAVVLAVLIGLPTLRLRGMYFAVGTLALAQAAQTIVANIFTRQVSMPGSFSAELQPLSPLLSGTGPGVRKHGGGLRRGALESGPGHGSPQGRRGGCAGDRRAGLQIQGDSPHDQRRPGRTGRRPLWLRPPFLLADLRPYSALRGHSMPCSRLSLAGRGPSSDRLWEASSSSCCRRYSPIPWDRPISSYSASSSSLSSSSCRRASWEGPIFCSRQKMSLRPQGERENRARRPGPR